MARVTTSVRDTAHGAPAEGVRVRLYAWNGDLRRLLKIVETDANGNAELPLAGERAAGVYELVFSTGDYFRAQGANLPDPPFLDEVVVRFGIADGAAEYHVPLLIAPYGYTAYRG